MEKLRKNDAIDGSLTSVMVVEFDRLRFTVNTVIARVIEILAKILLNFATFGLDIAYPMLFSIDYKTINYHSS